MIQWGGAGIEDGLPHESTAIRAWFYIRIISNAWSIHIDEIACPEGDMEPTLKPQHVAGNEHEKISRPECPAASCPETAAPCGML